VPPLIKPVDGNTAVSCASGKYIKFRVPPMESDQPPIPPTAVSQFDALVASAQYTVLAASNVIPLLPLASPNRVPDTGAAAPAIMMSRKSASVPENAAQVSVRVVPMASVRTKVRMVALVPAESVSVPLMVWFEVTTKSLMPADVRPATVKLRKVFAPDTCCCVAFAPVKLTS